MASRGHKKTSGVDTFAILPKVLNSCLLVCVLFNFLALAWSVRSTTPRTVRTVETVVTNHFFTITQTVERVSSASRDLSSVKVESVGFEVQVPYHYMVIDGKPMIRFYGQTFKVGDTTSYGKIESIYPDRVRLEGSTFLKNTQNPDGQPPKTAKRGVVWGVRCFVNGGLVELSRQIPPRLGGVYV